MTDMMEATTVAKTPGMAAAAGVAIEDLAAELLARAESEGVSLVGPGRHGESRR